MLTSKKYEEKHEMTLQSNGGRVRWRCGIAKLSCNESVSVRKNTWLEGSTLALEKIILQSTVGPRSTHSSIKFADDELGINGLLQHLSEVSFLFEYYNKLITKTVVIN